MLHQSIHPESIKNLPVIRERALRSREEYVFLNETFIRPFCVAFLDQTFLHINKIKKITLLPFHLTVYQYLRQCSFDYLYGNYPILLTYNQDNIIPIKRFKGTPEELENDVINWVSEEILKFIPMLLNKLDKKIVKSIWEIIQNALIHSENEEGLSACGQFYPRRGYFEIAFYDAGIGIANKIKNSGMLNNNSLDSDYIEWAMDRGNSTIDKPNAGLGLFILRNFLKINKGAFQIISGNGYFGHLSDCREEKRILQNTLNGTLINLRIIFDQNIYYLKE